MASKRDYYEILGVPKSASEDDLKKAFRKLAVQFHPDKNPGDKEAERRFKEISEAYDTLKDDQKRTAYDRYGHGAFESGGFGGGGGHGHAHPGFDFSASGFADIFEDLFGGGGQRGRQPQAAAQQGSDLRYNLGITLEEAFKGKQETIRVTTSVACDVCAGTGAEKGSKPVTCPTCHGHGAVRMQQGFFTIERTCHACAGTGQIIKDPCRKCAGSGRVRKEKTLSVTIPPGVEEGTRIRLAGEGEAGARGGAGGDIYIFVSIKPHPIFKREGANILVRVPIKFTTATLGGAIEVPTIDGTQVKVTIPEGTQTGHQFRLKGKGMSQMRTSARGDMFIQVSVETPVKISKRQKALLQEFDTAGTGKESPEAESFFGKVREFFGNS